MNYRELLDRSYERENAEEEQSRYAYLSEYIFMFTTYDSEISDEFGQIAVAVCEAVTNRTTFEFIKDPENYRRFILLCNTPFFSDRIEWGTSIRGAWWRFDMIKMDSCGLWSADGDQLEEISFPPEEWGTFMQEVIAFARNET
jgi:hypothetical protein